MKPFTQRAVEIIQKIPEGKVMTYGQIAALAGSPRGARQVVRILHSMSKKHKLPWHRVINSKGEVSLRDDESYTRQILYLQGEGVHVTDMRRIDLAEYQYHPDRESSASPICYDPFAGIGWQDSIRKEQASILIQEVNVMSKTSKELPVLFFSDQQSFEQWLEANHAASTGIRLQISKKNTGIASVTYDEAVESALCYGWVDSQKEKYDEQSWLQRFTPRGAKSIWSKVNREKAEKLIANGRMKPSGLQAIEAAKQNGLWDKAYDSQKTATMPEDFAAALERNAKAKAFYETLDKTNKYAILFRIHNVKKQETRMKKIEQFVMMLERGEKIYPKTKKE